MTKAALDDYQRTTGATKEDLDALERLEPPAWDPPSADRPKLAREALYGLAGKIVETIQPYTEADPVATLSQTATLVGNLVGPGPHALVERDEHPCRLFTGLVGRTAGARKGTSLSTPRHLVGRLDDQWRRERFKQGLSSGEGLIENVRDPMDDEEEPEEPLDRRLMVIEPELAVVLKNMSRESNTLSAILRQAWDSGNLSTLTRHSPLKATGAHISLIGHITQEELRRYLNETERANGFANRILWLRVERSKLLPEGGGVPDDVLEPLIDELRDVVAYAGQLHEIRRDDEARAIWAAVYPELSAGKPGMLGAILSRAEAQVLRLSVLYAVLDKSRLIRPDHLKAALALWEYAEQSARVIFGSRLGNAIADRILEALRQRGELTETEISKLFSGHESQENIKAALLALVGAGLVETESRNTGGRPVTVWRLAKKAK